MSPDLGKQRHTATPLSVPPRRLKTLVRSSGDLATLGDFAPHACPRPAALAAEPRSGPGRKPRASRVRGCKPQPRAPHPTGLGYPAPAKLSLCPTSECPREAPLTGQDASRISEVLKAGIGIHSQFRERWVADFSCPGRSAAHSSCGAVRCRAGP